MYTETTDKSTFSVSEITFRIKNLIENSFDALSVQGEISNLTRHRSGHKYFTLKDEKAQLKSVMWKSRNFPDSIANGDEVVCKGRLSLYAQAGNYQLDCTSIKPIGQGNLYEAFTKLKEKLAREGLFDSERKMSIPRLPKSIGLITSATGAAVQDILSTLNRRIPFCRVSLIPTKVQGIGADGDIVQSIEQAINISPDVIILSRGGGSIEDLWCFNSELLASAISKCPIPIISGVGHEIDFTISDFVSDLRAPTPTAAAELASPITADDLLSSFRYYEENSNSSIQRITDSLEFWMKQLSSETFTRLITKVSQDLYQMLDFSQLDIENVARDSISKMNHKLEKLENSIKDNNPQNILNKGYAVVFAGENQILPDHAVSVSQQVRILTKNKQIDAEIKAIKEIQG